jgi:hypothetical protein
MRLSLTVLLVFTTLVGGAPSASAVSAEDKMRHYCTNWGAAGLFPEDSAKVKGNPMASMSIDLGRGNILSIPFLYIEKGFRLEGQREEWSKVWSLFTQACPQWPRPQWVQKLEAWKQTKSDPLAVRRQSRIRELQAKIQSTEAQLAQLLRRIQGSPGYLNITGGRDTWHQEAENRAAYLRQIVGLPKVEYTLIGKVESRSPNGIFVAGMALAPSDARAPGTATTTQRLFIMSPKASWTRGNQDFYGTGIYLQSLPDARNPQLIYGAGFGKDAAARVASAKAELGRVQKILRGGKRKLARMMRPVKNVESSLASHRAELAKLRAKEAK